MPSIRILFLLLSLNCFYNNASTDRDKSSALARELINLCDHDEHEHIAYSLLASGINLSRDISDNDAENLRRAATAAYDRALKRYTNKKKLVTILYGISVFLNALQYIEYKNARLNEPGLGLAGSLGKLMHIGMFGLQNLCTTAPATFNLPSLYSRWLNKERAKRNAKEIKIYLYSAKKISQKIN